MEHSAIETETAELSSQARLEQLRKTVDEGVHRPLPWRQAQLDGLLQFISDHEEAMLAALKADLGRCAAEARLADILMVRSELKLMRRNLRRWLQPRHVHTPLAAQPGPGEGATTAKGRSAAGTGRRAKGRVRLSTVRISPGARL